MVPQFYKANKGCLLNLDQADVILGTFEYNDGNYQITNAKVLH